MCRSQLRMTNRKGTAEVRILWINNSCLQSVYLGALGVLRYVKNGVQGGKWAQIGLQRRQQYTSIHTEFNCVGNLNVGLQFTDLRLARNRRSRVHSHRAYCL